MRIGKRTQITDLRSVWATEPDFSDWLASEDGLALIAEDIGIAVEDARRESRPGDYPADIVGHALGDDNHMIVIENQFGKTNHDHLGKLLTYAAMHSATTGIWVSQHISNDHRKVIDWLNDNTPPNVSFYLAQLKAYQIDNSAVAPQLDVVCRPNLQVKIHRSGDDLEMTQTQKWRSEIWQDILDYISDQNPPFSVQSPSDDHWSNITIGKSGFCIRLTLVPKNHRIGCELAVYPAWKDEAYQQLFAQQAAISTEIEGTLKWHSLPDKKSARILIEAAIDPKLDSNRLAVKEWMHRNAVAFYNAFYHRVKNLKPGLVPDNPPIDEPMDAEDDELMKYSDEQVIVHKTTVDLVHGSAIDQNVDAVVNAANEAMRGGGGIDRVIHQAAGPGLLAELETAAPQGAKTGDAVITGGHKLKQPYIIHTPGPRWSGGNKGEPSLLASSYQSCMEKAEEKKLKSIAFCSISTGIFGYPLEKAAPLALKTVRDYLDAHPDTSLERIVFAMHGVKEYEAFQEAWAAMKGGA